MKYGKNVGIIGSLWQFVEICMCLCKFCRCQWTCVDILHGCDIHWTSVLDLISARFLRLRPTQLGRVFSDGLWLYSKSS